MKMTAMVAIARIALKRSPICHESTATPINRTGRKIATKTMERRWSSSMSRPPNGSHSRRRTLTAPNGHAWVSSLLRSGPCLYGKAIRHGCRTLRLRALLGDGSTTTSFHNRITRYLTYRDIQMLGATCHQQVPLTNDKE